VGQRISVKGKCNKIQNEMNTITWHLQNHNSLTQIRCQDHSIHYVTGQDASSDIPPVSSSQGTFLVPPKGVASIQTMEPENAQV